MKNLLTQLLAVFGKQLACCNQLLQMSQAERSALKENDVQGLLGLCQDISILSQELAHLEDERTELHSQACSKLGLADCTNLRSLLSAVRAQEPDLAASLEKEAAALNASYTELKRHNETNQLLLRQAAAYAATITRALQPDTRLTYSKEGDLYRGGLQSPFVNRTV